VKTKSHLTQDGLPEAITTFTNLSTVLPNQPDSGSQGITKKWPLLGINMTTHVGHHIHRCTDASSPDRRAIAPTGTRVANVKSKISFAQELITLDDRALE
jgi:hypothetical protein